jgi:hypothetical protein
MRETGDEFTKVRLGGSCIGEHRGRCVRILISSSTDIKSHILAFTFFIGFNAGAVKKIEHTKNKLKK